MNVLISAYYSAPSSGNFIGSLMDLGLKAIEAGRKPSNAEEICKEYSIDKWCDDMMQIYDKVI